MLQSLWVFLLRQQTAGCSPHSPTDAATAHRTSLNSSTAGTRGARCQCLIHGERPRQGRDANIATVSALGGTNIKPGCASAKDSQRTCMARLRFAQRCRALKLAPSDINSINLYVSSEAALCRSPGIHSNIINTHLTTVYNTEQNRRGTSHIIYIICIYIYYIYIYIIAPVVHRPTEKVVGV